MEKETVMEKCPTDIRALKNLKDAFDVFLMTLLKMRVRLEKIQGLKTT